MAKRRKRRKKPQTGTNAGLVNNLPAGFYQLPLPEQLRIMSDANKDRKRRAEAAPTPRQQRKELAKMPNVVVPGVSPAEREKRPTTTAASVNLDIKEVRISDEEIKKITIAWLRCPYKHPDHIRLHHLVMLRSVPNVERCAKCCNVEPAELLKCLATLEKVKKMDLSPGKGYDTTS